MNNGIAYSEAVAEEILERIASGESLVSMCAEPHLPQRETVHRWVMSNFNGFAARYETARMLQAMGLADEVIDLADRVRVGQTTRQVTLPDGTTQTEVVEGDMVLRARLMLDTRKWYLSKVMPKIFGDRVQHDHTGTLTLAALVEQSMRPAALPEPAPALVVDAER